jgi:bla regulator protein BlaR1
MTQIKNVRAMLKSLLLCTGTLISCSTQAWAGELGPTEAVKECFNGDTGVFVMHDTAGKTRYQYNDKLVSTEFSPCSTFKIFLGLVGLETGIIKDENTSEKWDGTKEPVEAWNRDQNLKTAMSESVNWYFQKVGSRIGKDDLNKYLKLLNYGNEDISSGIDSWMDPSGSLRITPAQQIEFLDRLVAEKLPVSARSQQIIKRILQVDEGPNGVLFGKTGTEGSNGKLTAGWFVGFVQGKDDNYIFATHIQAPNGASGRKAREISKAILKQFGAW